MRLFPLRIGCTYKKTKTGRSMSEVRLKFRIYFKPKCHSITFSLSTDPLYGQNLIKGLPILSVNHSVRDLRFCIFPTH